jgi:ribosomal-protein-alanine N-acetyltransferase
MIRRRSRWPAATHFSVLEAAVRVPHIRWMIRRDMPEVLQIEADCFGATAWAEEDFLLALRQRNCIGVVCDAGETVVGYMIYELEPKHLHVCNMAVSPLHRRQGIGLAMVDKLKSKLSSHRRTKVILELAETNLPAQLFFRSQGFLATGVLRGFYEDGLGAIRMVLAPEFDEWNEFDFEAEGVNRIVQYEKN